MTARLLRVHHVQISIPGGAEDKARNFYCKVLGLKEIPRPEELKRREGFWAQIGDFQIHFLSEDGVERAATKSHIAYEVNNVKQWRAVLERNGVVVMPGASFAGLERIEFRDPFQNRVEWRKPGISSRWRR